MRARHGAGEIGDGGNQRRPGLDRCVVMRTVVAAGVEAQGAGAVQRRDAAPAQIGLGQRAGDRPRHGEQPAGGFRRAAGNRRAWGRHRLRPRQAEEGARLGEHVAEPVEPAVQGDEVEQIAIFARVRHLATGRLRPCRGPARAAARTGCGRGCRRHRRPASSGLRGGHGADNSGTPPRHRARAGAPGQRRETSAHAAARSATRTSG